MSSRDQVEGTLKSFQEMISYVELFLVFLALLFLAALFAHCASHVCISTGFAACCQDQEGLAERRGNQISIEKERELMLPA